MKILVVEDDRKVARLLQRVLLEEGYAADVCVSGTQALVQAKSGIYDLIVLDWMIPGVDGLEVCRELRRTGSTIPILMLTARGGISERVLGLGAGADDYLVKPFDVDEMIARVAALLRRVSGHPRMRIGPLEIDREASRVLVDGVRIELTARELRVLLHLAYREGHVVSRTELLIKVWETKFDPESNVVEVHVSRLRDKLGKHAAMIETVRGRGYRLRDPTR